VAETVRVRKLKSKPCRQCKVLFHPRNSLQIACCPGCAISYISEAREKKAKAEIRKAQKKERVSVMIRKNRAKTKSEWLNDLQKLVNKYVRLRDLKDACISCEKPASWGGQWHCSHYYAVGSSSFVRFNLWNLNKSCSVCNTHLSGNIGEYTPRIIEKIGQDRFDWLFANRSNIANYDVEWIKRAIKIARKGIKRQERRQWKD
tara:strand:+ start:350 stop:958 length:609 start_codon:yes stop_codon:yes gene_type:complete